MRQIDQEQTKRQLTLLGYSLNDRIYLADFVGKPPEFFPKVAPRRWDIAFDELNKLEQDPHKGLYLVVNGQGQKDADVQYARAVFIEHDFKDGLSKDEQKVLWQSLDLPEPTFQVETRNSIHQYWVFSEKVSIDDWKVLINDLIIYTKADKANKNPSRVFRLAGSWHIGKDEQGNDLEPFQNRIIAESGNQYTFQEIRDSIPTTAPELPTLPQTKPLPKKEFKAIPLEQLCSVAHRDIVLRGVSSGSRNTTLSTLVRDALGCENWCRNTGVEYTGSARSLLEEANSKCNPPLTDREIETIWKSALKDNPTPCLSEDKLLNCLDAWQKPKKQYNLPSLPNSLNTNARNHWEAPASLNGELGEWKIKQVPQKIIDENGVETLLLDEKGDIVLKKQQVFEPKADFDFEILDYLEDDNGGGYKLNLKQTNNVFKEILLKSLDTSVPKDFITALKKAYKSDLICSLKGEEIGALLHVRLQQYYDKGGKRHILAPCRGKQKNGYWVFETIQFDSKGNVCTSEQSGIVWNPSYGDGDAIPNPTVLKPNKEILGKVLRTAKALVADNKYFMPTFFVISAQIMGLFYDEIFKHNGWFPLINATGDAASGKTNSTRIGQALVGLHEIGGMSSSSKSMLYESLSKVGCLTLSIDDPAKDLELEEIFKGLFNGLARTVRGNTQLPHSSLIITSNHPLGEHSSAITSRFIHIPFFRSPVINQEKRAELIDLFPEASGAFSQLISIGYNHKKIRELAKELSANLVDADSRSPETLSVLTYYALALAPYAGLTEQEVKFYVLNTLCKTASQASVNQDSLFDFIEKCESLKGESKIGDWNYRIIKKRVQSNGHEPEYYAVVLDSVWKQFEAAYKPVYGMGTLKELVTKAGGIVKDRQKFSESKNAYEAWERQKNDPNNTLKEPERVCRTCMLIPTDYIQRHTPVDDGFNGEYLIEILESHKDAFEAGTQPQPVINQQPPETPPQPIETSVEILTSQPESVADCPFKVGDKVFVNGTQNQRIITEITGEYATVEDESHMNFKYPIANLKLVDNNESAITVEPITKVTVIYPNKSSHELARELTKVVYEDDFTEIENWYNANRSNYETFCKVWENTPLDIRYKILALTNYKKITKIKYFNPFTVPAWCPLVAGSLVVHNSKLYWFCGIPNPLELTTKHKNKSPNWVILQELNNNHEILAAIEEVEVWTENSVNTG